MIDRIAQDHGLTRAQVKDLLDAGRLYEAIYGGDECALCHGGGRIDVTGYSLNPFSGLSVPDPQETYDVPCPDCRGAGTWKVEPRRKLGFERGGDNPLLAPLDDPS